MLQRVNTAANATLRVGVVGVGVMGSNHARVLAEMPGVVLAGVADPDPDQVQYVGTALGCPAVSTIEALFDLGVDAVTIAAPTHLHHEIALACIARGIHVMVEKPIASTVEEGRDIVAAARRAGVTLMVGHVERFNPAVQPIKRGDHRMRTSCRSPSPGSDRFRRGCRMSASSSILPCTTST